jgi:hypothetical protein
LGRIVAVLPLAATTSGICPRSGPDDSLLDFSLQGASRNVQSPARQLASLLMFRLPSTSGRVVLVVRHFAPSRTATNTSENREQAQMWRIVYMELAKNFLTQDAIVRPISNMTEP